MKKVISAILSAVMLTVATVNAFAQTDTKIFTDTIENTYTGRAEAKSMISNLKFTDVASNYWAKEAITKAGALDMVKGYDRKFNPTASISNQEAIAFCLRVMGLESEAQAEGVRLQNTTDTTGILPIWSLGYLSLANQNGLITNAQYRDAINTNQDAIDPETGFFKNNPATREQVADWLVQALDYVYAQSGNSTQGGTDGASSAFNRDLSQQKIYTFKDWKNIDAKFADSVELVAINNIMLGDKNGNFNPKAKVTRAEMAQILANMDDIYNDSMGLVKKHGTVGGIRKSQLSETGGTQSWDNIYIRNENGKVDILQYQLNSTDSVQAGDKDAVVYNNGTVLGLKSLKTGDKIEYLVNPTTNEIYFVKYEGGINVREVDGTLEDFDYENGQIHLVDSEGKRLIYSVADGLYGNDGTTDSTKYVYLAPQLTENNDQPYKKVFDSNLPYGSKFKVQLKNEIVTMMSYEGEPTVVNELRGIVVENNVGLGYLTFIDNNGNEVTKNYYAEDLVVEKQQYYDSQDEIGYIDQIFPNFQYDPRDTTIDQIEAGDIVFVQTYKNDASTIEKISASTNYTMKYGKLRQFTTDGDISQMLIEYEDGQTAWFDVANSVFVSKEGKPLAMVNMQAGDWVKILVNQAIISPGYVMESVKEINVEGSGHEISNVIKGQLGAINQIQKELSVQNSYSLSKNGWGDYKEIRNLSIDNNDITYYYEGQQISLDYAMQYLKRADGDVYIALENNYAGERVSMVSFRNGRGNVIDADTVINADGIGSFATVSSNGVISTDNGTIVIRHGRLVSGHDIMIPDYALVELNGGAKAAVVDITDQPDVSAVAIARGRILSVDEGNSFKVKSMSLLGDMDWIYTPVEREFVIDNSTVFINAEGVVSRDTFIDYTENSVVNKAYYVLYDGTRATHVIDAPFAQDGVRGEVYSVADGSVGLKDTNYYVERTGGWKAVSNKDNSINITTATNTIVIKNNKVVGVKDIEVGDKVKVHTAELPDKITGSMTVAGYIILVEN